MMSFFPKLICKFNVILVEKKNTNRFGEGNTKQVDSEIHMEKLKISNS